MNRMIEPAFALYREMITSNIEPDSYTSTALLLACSHTGAVERARQVLKVMSDRGLKLDEINQSAFLDVLARSSDFDAAEQYFLRSVRK